MGIPIIQNWGRLVSAALSFIVAASLISFQPANASTLIFQKQGNDNYEPAGEVRYDHETRNMAVEIYDDNKDLVTVRLTFSSNVTNNSFASSSTLLRVKFMPYLSGTFRGNTGNIWIEAPRTPYQGSKKIPAVASAYVSEKSLPTDPRKDMSSCGAVTWMDDVSSRNMVSFQFSRNCFDLPNTFWAISQVETDIFNSTLSKDVRYTPIEPFYVDMQSVPKPPKVIPKKDQTVSASTPQREYFVDNNAIQIIASSSGGVPVTYNSRTPDICFVTSTGLIQPKAAGSCQVAVEAPGSTTLNPAPPVLVTITLIRKAQSLYFDPPGMVYMSQGYLKLAISSEFNLPVQVVSTSPTICTFPLTATEPTVVQLLRPGTCSFRVSQAGNAIYNPREGVASFEIYADPVAKPTATAKPKVTEKPKTPPKPKTGTSPTAPEKGVDISVKGEVTGGNTGGTSIDGGGSVGGGVKKKITCVKPGAKNREISGVDPKCPTGYKKK